MKHTSKFLLVAISVILVLALSACSSGPKVTFVLPEGATGTAPAGGSYKEYAEVTLPAVDSALNGATQSGWVDASGNYYANGSTICMGSMDMKFTAVYEASVIAESFCENPGTMNFGGRLIGPTAAYTKFYADKTWSADANGVACFSHFEGTWDLTADGKLSMVLVEQDGVVRNEALEISSDGKTFTYTLTNPGDRGGLKYHVNHISAYALISAYNKAAGASVAEPAEPEFTVTFASGREDFSGETAAVSGKLGEKITLPACGYTTESANFTGWKCTVITEKGENGLFVGSATLQPGDTLEILGYDVVVTASWDDAKAGGGGWGF